MRSNGKKKQWHAYYGLDSIKKIAKSMEHLNYRVSAAKSISESQFNHIFVIIKIPKNNKSPKKHQLISKDHNHRFFLFCFFRN